MRNILQILLVVLLCSFSYVRVANYTPHPSVAGGNIDDIVLDVSSFAEDTYNHLGTKELFFKPYKYALKGYYTLLAKGKLANTKYITIVDMTKSANTERMFVIETETWQVVHSSLVSHGMNTGELYAKDFSNEESSHQSSLGFYITGRIYDGKHDRSLKLKGQEFTNNQAYDRGVVVHAADYVSKEYIKTNGRLGRSYGCPAIPHEGYDEVIDMIKNGSCYFIYYPEKDYLKKSKIINSNLDIKLNCNGEFAN